MTGVRRAGPFYGADLARVHDAGFGTFARAAAPGIDAILSRSGARGGRVLDLGCGSGVLAGLLARRGYRVTGVDISAAMIARARARVPGVRFHRGSFLDVPFPSSDAVVSVGECLNYLHDRRMRRGGIARICRKAWKALRPGGLILFDLLAPPRAGFPAGRTWAEGLDWAALVESRVDPRGRTLTRRIVTLCPGGERWRRRVEIHRLHLPTPAEVLSDLRHAGFRARRLAGYGGLRFDRAGHAAFLGTKAAPRSGTARGRGGRA